MRGLAGALAAALLPVVVGSSAALAADLPRYDPEGHCRTVAATIGDSEVIRVTCLDQEQEAYNGLKARWAEVPASRVRHCDEVARAIGGSYVILAECIRQEEAAASSGTKFQF